MTDNIVIRYRRGFISSCKTNLLYKTQLTIDIPLVNQVKYEKIFVIKQIQMKDDMEKIFQLQKKLSYV